MTIARTALRLAATQILKGTAAARPTLAGGRVFDSRIADIEPETFTEDAKPIIIVLTDGEEGEALSKQNGGPPFRRFVDLVLEVAMVQRVKEEGSDDWVVGYPDTDARHEASLDFLEFQIMRELSVGQSPMAIVFRSFARIVKEDSHRQVLDDSGVKVACRIVTLVCDTADDDVRMAPSNEVPTGMAVLPSPLSLVAAEMPPNTSGADVIAAIVAALTPIVLPTLDDVSIRIDAGGEQDPSDMVDVTVEIQSALDVPQIVAASAAIEIDYARGTFQNLILAADVTSLSVVGWPRIGRTGRLILQVTNTGNYGISGWPDGTKWTGGNAPTISEGAGKRDILVLTTATAGAEIFANVVGQDYR